MALAQTVINLFPGLGLVVQSALDLALVGLGLLALAGALAWLVGWQRREEVRLEARHRGLSPESTEFLVRSLGQDGAETARALLRSPELLRQRLAAELGNRRHAEPAARFASKAARLAEEMQLRSPPFEGAPRLFEAITLRDALEADDTLRTGYVVAVDEANLTFICPEACPWPVRRDLLIRRSEADEAPFEVTLLLRPMPGCREWVVSHTLAGEDANRRTATRVPCDISTWLLPTTAGTYALRARLQSGDCLEYQTLRRLPAWPRRTPVTLDDLASDGARLHVSADLRRGEHFYLVLASDDGIISALPLVEVVSVRSREDDQQVVVGTRFCAVRLRERIVLADFAQRAARQPVPS